MYYAPVPLQLGITASFFTHIQPTYCAKLLLLSPNMTSNIKAYVTQPCFSPVASSLEYTFQTRLNFFTSNKCGIFEALKHHLKCSDHVKSQSQKRVQENQGQFHPISTITICTTGLCNIFLNGGNYSFAWTLLESLEVKLESRSTDYSKCPYWCAWLEEDLSYI